jgi:ubiquinone/menaquinone biosynthesis C-methylase UbiE
LATKSGEKQLPRILIDKTWLTDMDIDQYRRNIATTFNDISNRYDNNKFFAISASKLDELIPDKKNMNVLDISTGTGAVAIEIAKKYQHASVMGIDISSGMLNRAKIKAKYESLNNIIFQQYDIDNLPYKQNTFDVVTCGYALFFYPDMEISYQAICNTIKPDGVFIFSSFTIDAFNPYSDIFLSRLEQDYKITPPNQMQDRLTTKDQIKELAKLNNPKKIEVEYFPIRYSLTIAEWWSLLNSIGYKSMLNSLSTDDLNRFKSHHLAKIETFSKDGLIELNTDILFGIINMY